MSKALNRQQANSKYFEIALIPMCEGVGFFPAPKAKVEQNCAVSLCALVSCTSAVISWEQALPARPPKQIENLLTAILS